MVAPKTRRSLRSSAASQPAANTRQSTATISAAVSSSGAIPTRRSLAPIRRTSSPPRRNKRAKTLHNSNNKISDTPPATPPAVESVQPDRLTCLSPELLALIFEFVSTHADPDLKSLFNCALVCQNLLPHVKLQMYRELNIEARVEAHSLHRTLHGNEMSGHVKTLRADVGKMSKTSSTWRGWFFFHSMHSLSGLIGSCRDLLHLNLFLPSDSTAWSASLCTALLELKSLRTLTKDLEPSNSTLAGLGRTEGMDLGWRARKNYSMWCTSLFFKTLATLRDLHTLRICGLSSDSSTTPPIAVHSLNLIEVVLVEINVTNSDLVHLLGHAVHLQKLTLWRSSLLSKRGLVHVLKRCPNLIQLKIGGSWFGAKEEDETNYPLDVALPNLPHLKILHVNGALASPALLLQPTTNLSHLLVSASPAFTPLAVHTALAQMRSDPNPPVEKLSLPEMNNLEIWSETWKFTVRATATAKGVILEDRTCPERTSESDIDLD